VFYLKEAGFKTSEVILWLLPCRLYNF